MPRKRRSTKSRIVKVAWDLFYKNGYENTTVDEIIALSKTSKGTFYHYFKAKDALLSSLAYLLDDKYRELYEIIDKNLNAYDTLVYLNHELFVMIEETIDYRLLAQLYSAQLITKDDKSLLDKKRFYYQWVTEILTEAKDSGEFQTSDSTDELVHLYTMYERALIYDWALNKGKYSLSAYSDKLIPLMLDHFKS